MDPQSRGEASWQLGSFRAVAVAAVATVRAMR
jgi:hypothetical protein